jgi:uncharacterized membrane protein (DUF485 family)
LSETPETEPTAGTAPESNLAPEPALKDEKPKESLLSDTYRYRMIIIFGIIATCIIMTPLQRHFTLGRYQHYGLSIACLGTGYLTQAIWSWRQFTKWARAAYLSTAGYFLFVGLTFYTNPWLDAKVSLQTNDQINKRSIMLVIYFVMSLALSSIWVKWIKTSTKPKQKKS